MTAVCYFCRSNGTRAHWQYAPSSQPVSIRRVWGVSPLPYYQLRAFRLAVAYDRASSCWTR